MADPCGASAIRGLTSSVKGCAHKHSYPCTASTSGVTKSETTSFHRFDKVFCVAISNLLIEVIRSDRLARAPLRAVVGSYYCESEKSWARVKCKSARDWFFSATASWFITIDSRISDAYNCSCIFETGDQNHKLNRTKFSWSTHVELSRLQERLAKRVTRLPFQFEFINLEQFLFPLIWTGNEICQLLSCQLMLRFFICKFWTIC